MERTITNQTPSTAWKKNCDPRKMGILEIVKSGKDDEVVAVKMHPAHGGPFRVLPSNSVLLEGGKEAPPSVIFSTDTQHGDFAVLNASVSFVELDDDLISIGCASKSDGQYQEVYRVTKAEFDNTYTSELPEFSSKEIANAIAERTREKEKHYSPSMSH